MSAEPRSTDGALPRGQRRVARMATVHVGEIPRFDDVAWRLELSGALERPTTIDWSTFQFLPTVDLVADFHAALGWSVCGLRWRGVRLAELAQRAGVKSSARFVRFSDGDLYDASLTLEDALQDDVLLAHLFEDAPLERQHGGPVRLLVPRKFGWKSVKWLAGVEFTVDDRPGFWERRGRPAHADPWREERSSVSR